MPNIRFLLLTGLLLAGIISASGCTPVQNQKSVNLETSLTQAEEEKNCNSSAELIGEYQAADYEQLWDRIRAGYRLTHIQHPRIDKHFRWYAKNKKYMLRVSQRASRYLHYIVEELEANNMPLELALLPIVESAFDPFAYSHGRASGMWQFIPGTGKIYGLKQNWWYDGRRDVKASTGAAIRYLSHLHKRFDGDWMLALAAYNSGSGNVSKAIRRNKRAGKPTDFWSLKLPRETRAYVPQLLSIAKLVGAPAKYDITLANIPNSPFFSEVAISSQIDLAQAAELAEIEMDDLYMLNPGFNRWATDPDGPHSLLLPIDKAQGFISRLNAIPTEERTGWQRYKVKNGDSLIRIAKRFNTSVAVLKSTNGLRGNRIRKGQKLLIPTATRSAKHYAHSADQRLERKQARGKAGSKRINYRVQSGDSFWKIAKRYKVKVSDLARWNGMAPKDPLKAGKKLAVWIPKSQAAPAQSASNNQGIIRKIAYNVRRGDSLARIAGKFNLTVKDILRWNSVNSKGYIHPGQSLTLFVDITKSN